MTGSLLFDPLIPWMVLFGVAILVLAGIGLALWQGLSGWALRGLSAMVLLLALSGPVYQVEDRAPLTDIVVMLEDQSASQSLADRSDQTVQVADRLAAEIENRANTELRRIVVSDAPDNGGTQLMAALSEALNEEPRARIAGIIALTDGQVHDIERTPDLPAPMHVLLTGRSTDWDRRLIVQNAPAFAIIDEPVTLKVRIEDSGAVPNLPPFARLEISIDGEAATGMDVPIAQDIEIPLTLPHGGRNVIQFSVAEAGGELTDRNNTALIQMNGVRDRLRVLLVSGEPHPGGRTWRNLLKSDSSVDLVHFTILRPPEKQDGVPVDELSLIAFPTRELFLEKIEDFDLIIFDRYKRRGILPAIYLDNVTNYVNGGGAVLVAAGPDFATADSIYRTPLSPILPARPTARVIEERYRPDVTETGERHPVTTSLTGVGEWGSWMRQIEVEPLSGHTLMTGVDDRPLLVLDRVGEGRVALLASDHAWLWSRGYEGGGPQLELLRRLAHWMMKEPELEEDALWAEAEGQRMRIIRRSLGGEIDSVTVTRPDGEAEVVEMNEISPGRFEATYDGPEIGLYRLTDGEKTAVIGLGPAAPKEFEQTIATADILAPVLTNLRGGMFQMEDGIPAIRSVREGRPASGRGWFGLTPRSAYETRDVTQTPLAPPWLVLLLASGFLLAGWLREGRR